MKQIVIAVIFCALTITSRVLGITGEFKMYNQRSSSVTLEIRYTGDAWLWNSTANRVVLAPYSYYHSRTFTNSVGFAFDAPKSADDGTNGIMPWGYMDFTLTSGPYSMTFSMNFGDENWNGGYDPGGDICLYFDVETGTAYFDPPTGSDVYIYNQGGTSIWAAYHEDGPYDTHLKPPVFLKNIVSGGNAGGTLKLNGVSYNSGDTALAAYSTTHTIGSNNERFSDYQSSGITYKHNNWRNVNSDDSLSRNVYLITDNIQQFAYFLQAHSATIQTYLADDCGTNSTVEFRDPWYLEANQTQPNAFKNFSSPHHPIGAYNGSNVGVFLDRSVGSGVYYSSRASQTCEGNSLIWTFQNWSASGATLGSSNSLETSVVFTSDNATVTANYAVSKPLPPTYLYVSGDPGDQVTLVWTDNPHSHVTQYDIYRSPDKYRPYEYAATVNSGVQTWTDDAWKITSGYTDSLVHYRLYSKYNYGSTHLTSDPSSAVAAYAESGGEAKRDVGTAKFVNDAKHKPVEYSIGNYPNPFNPTTTMFYQLVENSDVLLEVYDVSGRKVATVVDGQRSAGYHAKVWNAKDNAGAPVASGIYFYRFIAQPISDHKAFVASGKLLLMK